MHIIDYLQNVFLSQTYYVASLFKMSCVKEYKGGEE